MFCKESSIVAVFINKLYFKVTPLSFHKSYYMKVLFKVEDWNYSCFNVICQAYLVDLKNKL